MFLNCKTYRRATLCFLITILLACSVSSENRDRKATTDSADTENHSVLDLQQILRKGKLTVLTHSSTNSYFIYKGEPMGFEFELLSNYAKHLGVKLEVIIAKDVNELFNPLLNGKVDLVAANLAVTQDRASLVSFTKPYMLSKQVLVQRKPDNYKKQGYNNNQNSILNNPIELIEKEIYVHRKSSFYTRLKSLSDEIGGNIHLKEVPGDIDPEMLIKLVANGHIDYTIADEHIARLNQGYYPNLDISLSISFPQKIAWACNHQSINLLENINQWLDDQETRTMVAVLYKKYFTAIKDQSARKNSEFSSISGNKISPYDAIIKKYSALLGWDWRLIAAQMAQESRFNANAKSWAGAFGLMQMMPQTAQQFGVDSTSGPEAQIRAGVQYMIWLNTYWENIIHDNDERIKFVLASYNVGLGHVIDARNLTDCFGKDSTKWDDNVNYFLRHKSTSEFMESEWVKYGYCRCEEPVEYVEKILARFAHYQKLIV